MSDTLTPISVSDLAVWLSEQTWSGFAQSLASAYARYGRLTDKQEASARSMYAKAQARQAGRQAQAPANPVTEVGMYRLGDNIYRVKLSQAGRLYAMRFTPEGASRFAYEGGAIHRLSADNRMTVADAQEVGAQVGMCCVCGRDLIVAENIERGIGPVCARRV
jgi:hypothetical protein